jgi:hypothetical protein
MHLLMSQRPLYLPLKKICVYIFIFFLFCLHKDLFCKYHTCSVFSFHSVHSYLLAPNFFHSSKLTIHDLFFNGNQNFIHGR